MLSPADHAMVTAAVAAAERSSDGEIVTVVALRSDRYHDVALHWAVLATLTVMALCALLPGIPTALVDLIFDAWRPETTPGELLTASTILSALTFLVATLLLRSPAARTFLTPSATKTRRVRARAIDLFRVGAEHRTTGRTGVLLYLSLAEHRAEIVADAGIHAKVAPEVWGEAMGDLVAHVRQGRIGEGMAAAVRRIGAVLAEHLPRSVADTNELPDRLIAL